MSPGPRSTSIASGILIHPAVWPFGHNGHGPKIGACAPLLGGAGFPSNNVACAEAYQSTTMPSFILIHPTIWPQYTNVTDRQTGQTDRQRPDSTGRTVLQTVAQKRFTLCYQTVVLSCLSVCNVGVLLPSGCMDHKNSPEDEIANVNFCAVRPEATRIR